MDKFGLLDCAYRMPETPSTAPGLILTLLAVNFDVSAGGIALQAMDSSHVCLVSFLLRSDGFDHFRCDRSLNMGIHIGNLAKVLKCAGENLCIRTAAALPHRCMRGMLTGAVAHAHAGNDDIITLKADDNGDTLTLMFESEKQDRVSDFDLKLMSIESE